MGGPPTGGLRMTLEGARPISVVRDLLLALFVAVLIPFAILLVGAPVALFVRLVLEAARLIF